MKKAFGIFMVLFFVVFTGARLMAASGAEAAAKGGDAATAVHTYCLYR